jgi:PRTRC genetic system protein B
MNEITTNTRLSPRTSIVIYHDDARNNYYLESRDIVKGPSGFEVMAAVPMSSSVLKGVAKAFTKNSGAAMSMGSLIPGHLLYGSNKIGQTSVMWYRPAQKRSLNFSSSLGIKGNSAVNIPATLYLVINNKLYIYALMDSSRPSEKTRLYNAPYFNIYQDGNVCLGTAPVGRVKARTYEGEAERFERGFYMAEQNGGNNRDGCKTPLVKLWKQLIKTGQAFPCKGELIQHKKYKTVGELLIKLIGNQNDGYEYQEDFTEEG